MQLTMASKISAVISLLKSCLDDFLLLEFLEVFKNIESNNWELKIVMTLYHVLKNMFISLCWRRDRKSFYRMRLWL